MMTANLTAKNLLFINYGLPYPPHSGSRIRDFNLIKNLARDHTVCLLSLVEFAGEARHAAELVRYCPLVEMVPTRRRSKREHLPGALRCLVQGRPLETTAYYYPEMADRIRAIVTEWDIDVVQIQQSFLAPYVEAVPEGRGCRTVLSFENLGFLQYRRMAALAHNWEAWLRHWSNALLMRRWEPRYAARFDHCVMVSPVEARLLQAANPRLRVAVVDNGVDAETYRPLPMPRAGNDLLYIGTMSYPPNEDAVLLLAEEILPRVREHVPDARLLVVGRDVTARISALAQRADVQVLGAVPDIVPCYEQARVTVVPLRVGGGTRLKILESMALGRPVVTTAIGAEGLAASDGQHLLVRDDPAEFARATVRLLQDPVAAGRLASNARALIEERYDWAPLSKKLAAIYEGLDDGRKRDVA